MVDYCITALGTVNDLQVESYAVTAPKPGFQTRIRIKPMLNFETTKTPYHISTLSGLEFCF